MAAFRTLAIAAGFVVMSSPAGAEPLKPSEILRHISGDWGYVFPPAFKPDENFCKLRKSRIWMEAQTFHYQSIRSDRPSDQFGVTAGRVVDPELNTVVLAMSLPPEERPANIRIEMPSEDSAIIQVRDSPALHFKRCPAGELAS
jgi:hypothetical protein